MTGPKTPPAPSRRGAASAIAAGLAATLLTPATLLAQPAPTNGPVALDTGWHALTNATVVIEPGKAVENATVILRNGVIDSVRANGVVPTGAREWDCTGLTIYPGLIDAFVQVDAPQPDPKAVGAHWNAKVTPQRSALDGEGISSKDREALRKLGFTVVGLAPKGGVFRGTGAVVSLADAPAKGESSRQPLMDPAFDTVALESSGWGARSYPGSQMGAIALVRQTLLDAQWRTADLADYAKRGDRRARPAPATALDALAASQGLPMLFVVSDEQEALRAANIAAEFDRTAVIAGAGNEFRRLDAIAITGAAFIVPLNFPDAPKIASLADAEATDLGTLLFWDQAPTNARRLLDAGVDVALTTDRLKNRNDFRKNIKAAIDRGLNEDAALAALTITPAEILGVSGKVGRVMPGYAANIIVVDGDLFDTKSTIRDVWVDGARYEINAKKPDGIDGEWAMVEGDSKPFAFTVSGEGKKGKFVAMSPTDGEPVESAVRNITRRENRVSFLVDIDVSDEKLDEDGPDIRTVVYDGVIEGDSMHLTSEMLDRAVNAPMTLTLTRQPTDAKDEKKDDKSDDPAKGIADEVDSFGYPFGAYAMTELPEQREVLVTNATIWTSADAGVIENGQIHIKDGKIVAVGRVGDRAFNGLASRIERIDARGKHITPGLIDAHSHTGIAGGVNEGTHAITAEVRIEDVIDADDISFYRQMAGGLTAANQLHGSANPIGGQNSVVKLRWGAADPNDLKIVGAMPGIKFALGENVKQSNWESDRTRYPQSRMGVETFIRDWFHRANDYTAAKERGDLVRTDLQLEALAEILAGERLVHCHSYRQDEIFMLCQVANDFGFQIGTFQHVLEGYKVAEAIKENAIGASAFSDWWAFKMEVIDAIPENGAIMHEVGVNVSFNSDNDELARRMNLEAAKAVKYGGVEPSEALKFVTINPAVQLGIGEITGSLEAGKDADFVIWSGDPLSTFSKCESTWIDGREYFSLAQDLELRRRDAQLRDELLQRILTENAKKPKKDEAGTDKDGDADKDKPTPALLVDARYDERTLDLLRETYLNLIRSGGDPSAHRCGDCGILDLHSGHSH
jgi:imidazolonepropionase-like amidohydrolase